MKPSMRALTGFGYMECIGWFHISFFSIEPQGMPSTRANGNTNAPLTRKGPAHFLTDCTGFSLEGRVFLSSRPKIKVSLFNPLSKRSALDPGPKQHATVDAWHHQKPAQKQ